MHSPSPREDMYPLNIAVTKSTDAVWIQVCGEVDLSNREQLKAALAAVDIGGVQVVHLDLHRLSFCDTSGCRLLLLFEREARLSGYATQIHGATPTIQKVACLMSEDIRGSFV